MPFSLPRHDIAHRRFSLRSAKQLNAEEIAAQIAHTKAQMRDLRSALGRSEDAHVALSERRAQLATWLCAHTELAGTDEFGAALGDVQTIAESCRTEVKACKAMTKKLSVLADRLEALQHQHTAAVASNSNRSNSTSSTSSSPTLRSHSLPPEFHLAKLRVQAGHDGEKDDEESPSPSRSRSNLRRSLSDRLRKLIPAF